MNVPATVAPKASTNLPMMNPDVFEQMQRVGRMLAMSPLFPDHLRKGTPEQAIANGVLVVNMAMRLNEDPLTVGQNIYFVGGKPGWNTTYLIAKANQHDVFKSPIDWEIKGKGKELSVTAIAELAATGKRVSYTADMAMAEAEGWTRNAKYKSIPELMLRYRSAAALIRLYCPEVMVGMPAQIEVELGGEMRDITPQEFHHAAPATDADQDADDEAEDGPDVIEGDDTTPAEETKPEQKPEQKAETKRASGTKAKTETEAKPDPDEEPFRETFDGMMNDLNDAPNLGAFMTFHEQSLAILAEKAPGLHGQLQEAIDEYKAAKAA